MIEYIFLSCHVSIICYWICHSIFISLKCTDIHNRNRSNKDFENPFSGLLRFIWTFPLGHSLYLTIDTLINRQLFSVIITCTKKFSLGYLTVSESYNNEQNHHLWYHCIIYYCPRFKILCKL